MMLVDRVIATLAILTVIGFLSILVLWVPRIDLIIVAVVVLLLTAYDFYRDLSPRRGKKR